MGDRFTVTADWLEARLGAPGLSIVDASWYLPVHGRDARAEYAAGHLPGAVFFDQDKVVDPASTLPHALPPARVFAQFAGSMGISANDEIVVYDGPGLFSAPRVWWLFRIMGARSVAVLEGGLDGWKSEGWPVTGEPTKIAPNLFDAVFDDRLVVGLDEMRSIVATGAAQIADARPAGRFTGADPEPRPGMRSGHMPGAANVPFNVLERGGRLLPAAELRKVFEDAGVDPRRPLVATCGSGVTAATLVLALETLGQSGHRLYDGSWSEWGGQADTPVATGPA